MSEENKNVRCDLCGEEVSSQNAIRFDGTILCTDCFNQRVTECSHCGRSIWRDDSRNGEYCQDCYDNLYETCTECGDDVCRDDVCYHNDEPYCQNCYDEINDSIIHDYYYKPDPIFYGKGQPHYGIEIEIDEGGEYDDNAERILNIGNRINEHIYCKHDGSLDDGFEIVSHPATLEYHTKTIPWKKILDEALEMGYYSHNSGTCGLHVHINRAALGESVEEQENTIARIVYFFEKFWDKILRFSRRTETQADRWASRYGCSMDNPKESLKGAKTSGLGRYTAVNLTNTFTVELRIFRGTLRYKTFMATLQFVDLLCEMAINLTDEKFQTMTWKEFAETVSADKAELKEYLKIRGLEE